MKVIFRYTFVASGLRSVLEYFRYSLYVTRNSLSIMTDHRDRMVMSVIPLDRLLTAEVADGCCAKHQSAQFCAPQTESMD